eukprot:TRINITY_DN1175_c0_g1_i1.p1 TRINITY_DN1175_c0_g1~~TRINITY_DN1175_c0_g1_i1.p1  ORF type:complete len:999 (+),score=327.93 TRINITY_DN1175_c0_g1_i1:58-2997(+)
MVAKSRKQKAKGSKNRTRNSDSTKISEEEKKKSPILSNVEEVEEEEQNINITEKYDFYDLIINNFSSIDKIIVDFVMFTANNPLEAFKYFFNFYLKASGFDENVNELEFEIEEKLVPFYEFLYRMKPEESLNQLFEEEDNMAVFSDECFFYGLNVKQLSKRLKSFKKFFDRFFFDFLESGDDEWLEKLTNIILTLTTSTKRYVRVTSTVCFYRYIVALAKKYMDLKDERLLEILLDYYDLTFKVKFRDVDDLIRIESIELLSELIELLPDVFLVDKHIRHYGWLLSDPSEEIRFATLNHMLVIYNENPANWTSFTRHFSLRLTDLLNDSSTNVRRLSVNIIPMLNFSECLEEVLEKIIVHLADDDETLASMLGEILVENVFALNSETVDILSNQQRNEDFDNIFDIVKSYNFHEYLKPLLKTLSPHLNTLFDYSTMINYLIDIPLNDSRDFEKSELMLALLLAKFEMEFNNVKMLQDVDLFVNEFSNFYWCSGYNSQFDELIKFEKVNKMSKKSLKSLNNFGNLFFKFLKLETFKITNSQQIHYFLLKILYILFNYFDDLVDGLEITMNEIKNILKNFYKIFVDELLIIPNLHLLNLIPRYLNLSKTSSSSSSSSSSLDILNDLKDILKDKLKSHNFTNQVDKLKIYRYISLIEGFSPLSFNDIDLNNNNIDDEVLELYICYKVFSLNDCLEDEDISIIQKLLSNGSLLIYYFFPIFILLFPELNSLKSLLNNYLQQLLLNVHNIDILAFRKIISSLVCLKDLKPQEFSYLYALYTFDNIIDEFLKKFFNSFKDHQKAKVISFILTPEIIALHPDWVKEVNKKFISDDRDNKDVPISDELSAEHLDEYIIHVAKHFSKFLGVVQKKKSHPLLLAIIMELLKQEQLVAAAVYMRKLNSVDAGKILNSFNFLESNSSDISKIEDILIQIKSGKKTVIDHQQQEEEDEGDEENDEDEDEDQQQQQENENDEDENEDDEEEEK